MTPRERFVEAMRVLLHELRLPDSVPWRALEVQVAGIIDAFADVECFPYESFRAGNDEQTDTEHEACRAAMRKECGL